MADGNESVSLVGATSRKRKSIDEFHWGRDALNFAGVTVAEYEGLAGKLGLDGAAEVLLIMITIACGTDEQKWQQARDLGIPWQVKRWRKLSGCMQDYNAAVRRTR